MATVLVVDDSETLRLQLKADLQDQQHNVLEACDGLEGVASIKKNDNIDVIICDVNMPNMDGITMCKTVKEELAKQIPILMLTTNASPEMKAEAKAYGVRAWVKKPYKKEILLKAVAHLAKGK